MIVYEEAARDGRSTPFSTAPTGGAKVAFRGNSTAVLVRAAAEGLGVVELPSYVADRHPDLSRVLPEHESTYDVWMVVHRDTRRAARVRAVCDAIAAAFRRASGRRSRRRGSTS